MTPAFVHIPKTAGKSVRQALRDIPGLWDIRHSTIPNQRKKLEREGRDFPQDLYAFCFVRNPFTRLRSSFYHLRELSRTDEKTQTAALARTLDQEYGGDFCAFVRGRGFASYRFAHFTPQSKWIFDPEGRNAMSFIGAFERMEEDFKILYALLGGQGVKELPYLNKTRDEKYRDGSWEEEWSGDMVSIIVEFYRQDFERLGYSPLIVDCELPPKTRSTL